jgi:molecular chaperone DnaJ
VDTGPKNESRNNDPSTKSSPSNKTSDHKNEGFLKSAWHKLTNQHENLEPDTGEGKKNNKNQDSSSQDDEPKKASGSG